MFPDPAVALLRFRVNEENEDMTDLQEHREPG